VDDDTASRPDAWAAACYAAAVDGGADGGAGGDARDPVFSAELGLAVEAPRDPGTTLRQLWCVP